MKRAKIKMAFAACFFAAAFTFFGCSHRTSEISTDIFEPRPLEFENVLQYKLDLNPETKVPEKFSGLCGRSSYCVSGIAVTTNKDTVIVLVKVSLFKGQSGSFTCPLEIDDKIQFLKFGNEGHLLWKRQ